MVYFEQAITETAENEPPVFSVITWYAKQNLVQLQ